MRVVLCWWLLWSIYQKWFAGFSRTGYLLVAEPDLSGSGQMGIWSDLIWVIILMIQAIT